jgi:guanylate kinase
MLPSGLGGRRADDGPAASRRACEANPMDSTSRRPRRGILFVMTGASGVGKGTLRQAAADDLRDIVYSVSATTRSRRPGETEGVEYHFLERGEFERMIAAGELLEHATYVGDLYGTPAAPVDAALAAGRDVLLEIELAGARQVKERRPEAVMIFIAPPSLAELERRLRGRGTDGEEKIQRRLARARDEIGAVREFDYVVVNDVLERAAATFQALLTAERARAVRLTDDEVDAFLDG